MGRFCPRRPLLGTVVQPSSSTVGVEGPWSTLGDCGCETEPFPFGRGDRVASPRGPRRGPPRRGPPERWAPREGARCSPDGCLQLPLSTARDRGISRGSRDRMGIFCSFAVPAAAAPSCDASFTSSAGASFTPLAFAASSAAAFSAASLAAASRARFSSLALSSASLFSLRRRSSTSRSRAAVSMGRAPPNGLGLFSEGGGAAAVLSIASEIVRLARFSFGRPVGIVAARAGEGGASLPSRDWPGDLIGTSGRMLLRQLVSRSAALGALSVANSRRGGREVSERPSLGPQAAGEALRLPRNDSDRLSMARERDPSRDSGRSEGRGDSGPRLSQLLKSRTLPSSLN